MEKHITNLTVFICSLWIAIAAFSSNLDRVIAIVNNDAITLSDYGSHLNLKQLGSGDTILAENQPLVVDKVELNALIEQRLQVQEALRKGMDVSESELDIAIRNISEQNGITEEQLLRRLSANNITEAEFRQSMTEQILIQKIVSSQVSRFIRVNDQEIEQFVKSYPDLFKVNESYELSHLRIPIGDLDIEQVQVRREYLEQIRTQVLAGQSLEQAIVTNDSTNLDYDYLGSRELSQIPEQVVSAIQKAGSESVTDILEISDILHLFVIHSKQGDELIATQIRLRQILIDSSQKQISNEEALELTHEIYNKIKSGEDFASLARKFSDDRSSSVNGGDLGWVNPDDIDPQLIRAISDLDINQLSEPISAVFGYYLIEVLETRKRNIVQEVIKDRARDMIYNRKVNSHFDSWIARIRSESYIELLVAN
ncbi:MAG: peptidylprolyl isomerase [Gammaproteobacteria bacterium]|nr:peptidylprolyl isomerase [Gammaproteobacteria bacterium]MCY4219071.1 peptidylprolyl isomerase [Gammaproteobacteria bacterium]MCY4276007.1 peptidylprolyl isomerase [Gammaproteobacteria bacterium]